MFLFYIDLRLSTVDRFFNTRLNTTECQWRALLRAWQVFEIEIERVSIGQFMNAMLAFHMTGAADYPILIRGFIKLFISGGRLVSTHSISITHCLVCLVSSDSKFKLHVYCVIKTKVQPFGDSQLNSCHNCTSHLFLYVNCNEPCTV